MRDEVLRHHGRRCENVPMARTHRRAESIMLAYERARFALPGRNRVGGIKIFPNQAPWKAARGTCEIQILIAFPPFLIEEGCLMENDRAFETHLQGQQIWCLFGRAPLRKFSQLRLANPYDSMGTYVYQRGLVETDNCLLHFRVDGNEDDARQLVDRPKFDIADFAEDLAAWGDLLSDQDPNPLRARKHRRVYARLHSGRRSTLYDANAEQEPSARDPLAGMLPIRVGTPVGFTGMQDIIARAARKEEFPFAWRMMRLALRSASLEQHRVAATEAGTAAELALRELYARHAISTGAGLPDMTKWTLGKLLQNYDKKGGTLPNGMTKHALYRDLVEVRNQAVHRGRTTVQGALGALRLAEILVRAAYPVSYQERTYYAYIGNPTDFIPIGPRGKPFDAAELRTGEEGF